MAVSSRFSAGMFKEYQDKGYWGTTTLSDIWKSNAHAYPREEAIADSRTRLTWKEADQWIDRLALGFLELGFKKDDIVVVQLPNSVELCLLRVACERAGLLCLPVLRTWRRREMEYVLDKVSAVGVVVPWKLKEFDYLEMIGEIRPGLAKLKHVFVAGEEVPEGVISIKAMVANALEDKYPADLLEQTKCRAEEFSLVAQTSGSTGFPKFVESPLCCRQYEGKVMVEKFALTESDVFGVLTPATGGPNIPAYFSAPLLHARVVMLEHFSPQEAFELIEKEQITFTGLVPAMLTMMLQDPQRSKYDLGSLRCIYCAGAVLSPEIGLEAQKKFGCTIVQVYGAMDAGGMTIHDYFDTDAVRLYTVGKPGPGNEIKLIDDNVPDGAEVVEGEVWARGPTLVTGYYNNPEAVAEVWTSDGWYRTGDLGRFDPDGNLRIVGRKKEMIIRGGQNIYPIEIENLLITHPAIAQVVVVKMPDRVMGEKACAYVVPETGREVTFEQMVSFLKEKDVAAYKLPERMELIDALPLLPSGKVDKKTLEKDIAEKLAGCQAP